MLLLNLLSQITLNVYSNSVPFFRYFAPVKDCAEEDYMTYKDCPTVSVPKQHVLMALNHPILIFFNTDIINICSRNKHPVSNIRILFIKVAQSIIKTHLSLDMI